MIVDKLKVSRRVILEKSFGGSDDDKIITKDYVWWI